MYTKHLLLIAAIGLATIAGAYTSSALISVHGAGYQQDTSKTSPGQKKQAPGKKNKKPPMDHNRTRLDANGAMRTPVDTTQKRFK